MPTIDEDDVEALTREERLRLMVNEDPNVEALLMRIRRSEMQAINVREQETNWEAAHPLSSRLVLSPGSGLKAWWDVAMLTLVLFSAITMPLDLAFDLGKDSVLSVLFLLLDASFVLDFVLCFRIAFAAPDSQMLIRQPSVILKRWLASWFMLDFIAAIPLASVDLMVTTLAPNARTGWVDALKLVRIVRILKLPRLLGTNPLWKRLRSQISNSYLQLTFGLSFLLYACHFCGCIYVVIARHELRALLDEHAAALGLATSANLTASATASASSLAASSLTASAGSAAAAFGLPDTLQGGWLPPPTTWYADALPASSSSSSPPLPTAGTSLLTIRVRGWDMYVYSLVYALTALSGTGVPYPHTGLEMGFTFLIELLGFLVTAYVIGTFTTALSQISAASNLEHQKRDYVDQFLQRKGIPKALRSQVAQFYEFAGFDDSDAMLGELPISLRLQLDLVLNRDLFLKVPFFRNCETSFLIVMVPRIHRECSWWGKTVVHEQLFATGLHMLSRGFCKATKEGRIENLLTTNDFFGEESLLTDTTSPHTISTVTQCQFMVLDTENFAELLEMYPQMKRALTRYTQIKQKSGRLHDRTKDLADKSKQLHRVRLELQRTAHTLSLEARQRLRTEIAAFAGRIKEQAEARRPSPAGLGMAFVARARASTGCANAFMSKARSAPVMTGAASGPSASPPRSRGLAAGVSGLMRRRRSTTTADSAAATVSSAAGAEDPCRCSTSTSEYGSLSPSPSFPTARMSYSDNI